MDEQAKAVVDLLRTMGLTIGGATLVCDRAKMLIQQEPLAKKDVATQCEYVATEVSSGFVPRTAEGFCTTGEMASSTPASRGSRKSERQDTN